MKMIKFINTFLLFVQVDTCRAEWYGRAVRLRVLRKYDRGRETTERRRRECRTATQERAQVKDELIISYLQVDTAT